MTSSLSTIISVAWMLVCSQMMQGLGFKLAPVPPMEIDALRDLFTASSGDQWLMFGVPWNFSGEPNPCADAWEGIECTCHGVNVDEENNLYPYLIYAPPGYVYAYDDGSGVLGAPCHVSKLTLGFTQLRGTLPTTLASLSFLTKLHVEWNELSGSIPFTALSHIQTITVQVNSLTGSFPATISQLTNLEILFLNGNHLSGTLPNSMGSLTRMLYMILDSNSISGPIPTELGFLSGMEYLLLPENLLTGPIPTSFVNISSLQIFTIFQNSISGSIPSCLGKLTGLQLLGLSGNSLTGSLPSSFGQLTQLQTFGASLNRLTGTVPWEFKQMKSLSVFLLYENSFSGPVDNLFDPQQQLLLQVVDLSNNQFSSTLPTTFFQAPNLTTVAMVENCFSGTLPSEMCTATSLQVLALDGLHTATTCQERFFSEVGSSTAYGLQPGKAMRGSIPPCLFALPNLTTLHLSGNALSGNIATDVVTRSMLADMSLAHNLLTGRIPDWISQQQWVNLDLAYNRLTGTVPTSLVPGANSSVKLDVNRLSGGVPASMKTAQNVNILNGNLFQCGLSRNSLPDNDPSVDSYQCGSNAVNFALAVWAVVLFSTAVLWLMICKRYDTRANEVRKIRTVSIATKAIMKSFAELTSVDVIEQMQAQGQAPGQWREHQHEHEHEHERESEYAHTPSSSTFRVIRSFASRITLLLCVVLMPTYAVLSVYFRNYSFVYTWAVSVPFLAGLIATSLVVCVWAIVGGVVSMMSVEFHHVTFLARSMSVDVRKCCGATVTVRKDMMTSLVEALVLLLFAVFNIVVIGGFNVAYVLLLTSGALRSAIGITFVEGGLGVVKGCWNAVVLPIAFESLMAWKNRLVKSTVTDPTTGQLLFHSLVILNNIVLPCIVEAFVNPNCFYNVIAQAPAIDVSYSYPYCAVFTGSIFGCAHFSYNVISTSFAPPFIYNFQCTAAILTNYSDVYVYSIVFISFIMPIGKWLSSEGNEAPPFQAQVFTTQIVNLLAILVTFGVVFPPLSIVVLVGIYVETYAAYHSVDRFVKAAGNLIEKRKRTVAMDAATAAVEVIIASTLWLLLPLSSTFNAMFVFDMLGNEVGWEQALGGLFSVMVALPLLMWGGYELRRRQRISWGRGGDVKVFNHVHTRISDSLALEVAHSAAPPKLVVDKIDAQHSDVAMVAYNETFCRDAPIVTISSGGTK